MNIAVSLEIFILNRHLQKYCMQQISVKSIMDKRVSL